MKYVCQHNIMNLLFYVYLVTICLHLGKASSKAFVSILFFAPAYRYPALGYFISSSCICSIKCCNRIEFFSVVRRGIKTCHKNLFNRRTDNFSTVNFFRLTITAQPPPLLLEGLGQEIGWRPFSSKSFSIFSFKVLFLSFCHVSDPIRLSIHLSRCQFLHCSVLPIENKNLSVQ